MAKYIGSMDRRQATFFNGATPPVATNPTTVTIHLLKPDGTISHPTAVSDGSGVYHFDIIYDQEGTYVWHFVGTGAVAASIRGDQYVTRSELVPVVP